jgi:hypothetical protein
MPALHYNHRFRRLYLHLVHLLECSDKSGFNAKIYNAEHDRHNYYISAATQD